MGGLGKGGEEVGGEGEEGEKERWVVWGAVWGWSGGRWMMGVEGVSGAGDIG